MALMNTAGRLLTSEDVAVAADVLAQAFENDPLCAFILPNKRTRVATLRKFFRPYGEVGVLNGRGFGVGEPIQGVAFWEFPEHGGISISIRMLGKFLPLLFSAYPIGLYRSRAIRRTLDDLHTQYAAGPHFYLDNLGVLPEAQGRGLSSKLIQPILEIADSQQAVVYTDTVTPENVLLYEHFGFQCVAIEPVANTGITVFALRRPIQIPNDEDNRSR
jgi:ribosomal protein S18 acetylase RimI-like enzyme